MSHPVDPLAAARALIDEPAVSPRCALPHVIGAWCAAAACNSAELVARLRAGAVGSLAPARRARVIAVLEAAVAAAGAAPWREAAVPSRRALRGCIAALERATGDRPRRRWRPIAAACAGVMVLAGMHWMGERRADRGGAWRAEYFANPHFAGTPVQAEVTAPSSPPPVAAPYSARFTTCLALARPVDAAFQVVAAGGATLYVDDQPIVGEWSGGSEARPRGRRIALEAGRHRLRIDHYGPESGSRVTVLASLDGGPPAPLRAVAPCPERAP